MSADTLKLPALYDSLQARGADAANFVALTPIAFLSRTADVHPDVQSVVYEDRSFTWSQTENRCQSLAAGLQQLGLEPFSTVSVLAFNTPEMFEAHFFVPLGGMVLNTINTRLEADTIGWILDYAEAAALMVDRELLPQAIPGLRAAKEKGHTIKVILIDDDHANDKPDVPDDLDVIRYDDLLTQNPRTKEQYLPTTVMDELAPLSINFTSGTSGRPKGVVYHHRGSYLMTLGTIAGWAVPRHPKYLYTVPLFHCNGWGHAWTMAAMAGTVVCLRYIQPARVYALMQQYNITHFGGAPIVLNILANDEAAPDSLNPNTTVSCMTAGAPPPATVLAKMQDMGCEVMHVYGLTETYGHILQAEPQPVWDTKSVNEVAELKARQGVRFPMTDGVELMDSNGQPVPADGETMGEIVIRGNTVMSGYLKNAEATDESLRDGWFWSGDLAVRHADGYIQIKDRAKDIIISGGENISSIEIENALYKHPAVGEAAVVAMPHEKWGETPCAFVELRPGQEATEQELIEHCLNHIASFKKPGKVTFGPLPKTATGKVQKYELRKSAAELDG